MRTHCGCEAKLGNVPSSRGHVETRPFPPSLSLLSSNLEPTLPLDIFLVSCALDSRAASVVAVGGRSCRPLRAPNSAISTKSENLR